MSFDQVPFVEAVAWLVGRDDVYGATRHRGKKKAALPPPPPEPDRDPCALRIWLASKPITGTLGETYLRRHRGITNDLPDFSLHFGRAWHMDANAELPAVVAAIARPTDRRIVAVQCTFLTDDGRKVSLERPRLTTGTLGTGAIRLAAASYVLGIAEGFEKALAATQLTGVPCWSSVGAGRLHRITLPNTVHTVHIFADNNDAGRKAAERAANRYRQDGLKVFVRFPPSGFEDYDKITQAEAGKVAA
jgi:hypothetical protein